MKARYRQYFEAEENSSPSNDSMLEDPIIPMETQVGNIPYFNSMNSIDWFGKKNYLIRDIGLINN